MKENKQTNNQEMPPLNDVDHELVNTHVASDVRASILIVSIVANLVILTAWIALQVTTQYDAQMVGFLFGN